MSKARPFFSVIIPVYNRKSMLEAAIESVRAQSFKDYEIIVVDDESDDGSLQLAQAKADHVLALEHSGLVGLVRNQGAKFACGKFLAFLDSDDLWLPHKLELQHKLLQEAPETKLVYTKEIWMRGGKEVKQKSCKQKMSGDIFEEVLWKCTIGPSTTVIDKDIFNQLGGFREDLEVCEDYEFWLRFCSQFPVAYIDKPCIIKQAGDWEQLSFKYETTEDFRIDALYNLIENNYFSKEKNSLAVDVLMKKLKIYLSGCLKRNKTEQAEEFAKKLDYLEKRFVKDV